MKKAEAISILAASVRPREAKDRARYDEAVGMAIEALKCSETPKSSEQNAETAQADHNADVSKKAEKEDCISRQADRLLIGKGGILMNELKKYVIEKEGYSSIVVSMTKLEAEIIEKFLEWAVIEDDFCITPVEDYVAVDWGGDE